MPFPEPSDVIDREAEWAALDAMWARPRPDLAFVVGRRRVGKSYMLARFARAAGGVYYRATRREAKTENGAQWAGVRNGNSAPMASTWAIKRSHRGSEPDPIHSRTAAAVALRTHAWADERAAGTGAPAPSSW